MGSSDLIACPICREAIAQIGKYWVCPEHGQISRQNHDYSVWSDSAVRPGQNWSSVLHSAIDDAVARGFVLVLLGPASLTSQFNQETEYALQLAARSRRSNVIPVVVAPSMREALPPHLANLQWFDLTIGRFDAQVEELIRSLKIREME
jgi:hypothetical protein